MNKKTTVLMIMGAVIFILLGWVLFAHFSSTTTKTTTTNLNGFVTQNSGGNSAPVASTSTRLSYSVEIPSAKQDDGLYHTLFTIFLYYPQGTQPKKMTISQSLQCPPISTSKNMTYSLNTYGVRFSLSCASSVPIIDKGGLFQI